MLLIAYQKLGVPTQEALNVSSLHMRTYLSFICISISQHLLVTDIPVLWLICHTIDHMRNCRDYLKDEPNKLWTAKIQA